MDVRKLGELIGKPYESDEVQDFTVRLGVPEVDQEIGAPETVYYIFAARGVTIITDSQTNRIDTIFLKAPRAERPGYGGPLPAGLDFSMTREQVLKALRAPDDSQSFYDAWEEGSHVLRVEYTGDRIKMIVLMGG